VNGLFYLVQGSDLVVVASNAGSESDPAWLLNLRHHPEAEVEIGGELRPVRAREATAEEAAALWPRLEAANAGFAAYRAKVLRPIPIVILEPS
jgi:deazaflavin-dependent oxidoreductase (nitroreductase family)